MKRLRWDSPSEQRSLPKHPYRDTAIVYGAMALVIVGVSLLTGGGAGKAIVIAGFFFVAATLWSWRNWRNRLRGQELQDRKELL
jgi:hypothetical protein